ncbi:MAG: VC0807 family protein [Chloroflexota bacterium]
MTRKPHTSDIAGPSGGHAEGRPRIAEVLPALQRGALRFVSAGVVPVAAFYLAFREFGPVIGIVTGMVVSLLVLSVQAYRIRRLDPIVLVPMILILVQGTLASLTGSVELYLAAPAVEAILWGIVLIGSTVLGRPLVPLIARELGIVPERFAASRGLHDSLKVLTVAWGLAAFAKAALRLWLLTWLPVEPFLVAVTVGIGSINVVMMGLSLWLPLQMVRRSHRPHAA